MDRNLQKIICRYLPGGNFFSVVCTVILSACVMVIWSAIALALHTLRPNESVAALVLFTLFLLVVIAIKVGWEYSKYRAALQAAGELDYLIKMSDDELLHTIEIIDSDYQRLVDKIAMYEAMIEQHCEAKDKLEEKLAHSSAKKQIALIKAILKYRTTNN